MESSDYELTNVELAKMKEIYIFGTCRTSKLVHDKIKFAETLKKPHSRLYLIENSTTNVEENYSIYTQPVNYTTKLTDVYDSIRYLTTDFFDKYLDNKLTDFNELLYRWNYINLIDGKDEKFKNELEKNFQKGRRDGYDFFFRETPTLNFKEFVFNVFHYTWSADIEIRFHNSEEAKITLEQDIRDVLDNGNAIDDLLKNTELIVRIERSLRAFKRNKNKKNDEEYDERNAYMNVPCRDHFNQHFFTFRSILDQRHILPREHPFMAYFNAQNAYYNKHKDKKLAIEPKVRFHACVFEIWNVDEYTWKIGPFAGLNLPFKIQSPHRYYPTSLFDKKTLTPYEVMIKLQEMCSMVGNCPVLIIGPYLSPTLGEVVNAKRRKTQEVLKFCGKFIKNSRVCYFDLTEEIMKDNSILISDPGTDGHETHLSEEGEKIMSQVIYEFIENME